MFGNLQVQKNGVAANGTCGPFASGFYASAGFLADPASVNKLGLLWDALKIVVPNSGEGADALKSFSVVATGNIANGSGNWVFNLCVASLTPAVTNGQLWAWGPITIGKQPLPQPSARAAVTLTSQTSFNFEADVTVQNGILSGTWFLSLNGSQVASGNLINLPTNLNLPIAAYLQIGAMPPAASLSNVVLAVSVAGYAGPVSTLNL